MNSVRRTILRALERAKGDDLERAERAFRNCTPEEMREEYGASGQTRAEILQEYRDRRAEINAAIEWAKENVK